MISFLVPVLVPVLVRLIHSWWGRFLASGSLFPHCVLTRNSSGLFPSSATLISPWGPPFHDPITSRRAHLLTPSHPGLGLQCMNGGGVPEHSVHDWSREVLSISLRGGPPSVHPSVSTESLWLWIFALFAGPSPPPSRGTCLSRTCVGSTLRLEAVGHRVLHRHGCREEGKCPDLSGSGLHRWPRSHPSRAAWEAVKLREDRGVDSPPTPTPG